MTKFEKVELEKEKIREHFRKQRRKVTLIFWSCDIAAVIVSFFLTKMFFNQNHLVAFIVSLFFIVVFPITQYSKKQKELTKAEREQIKFLEQDI